MPVILSIFLSILLVSAVSLVGAVLLSLHENIVRKWMLIFVGFSTGALLANVFLHILPELALESEDFGFSLTLILLGIVLSFILEKVIHWRHCHDIDCHDHIEPVGPLTILGDGLHNVVDGVLIASSFLVSVPLGITTTIAVMLHEIPQEFGDFAILLHSGYSRGKALLLNFFSALTAFAGAGLVIALQGTIPHLEVTLLAIVAGNFLYIAGSDLIPELHKETRLRSVFTQLIAMFCGIAVIYGFLALGGEHSHAEEASEVVEVTE